MKNKIIIFQALEYIAMLCFSSFYLTSVYRRMPHLTDKQSIVVFILLCAVWLINGMYQLNRKMPLGSFVLALSIYTMLTHSNEYATRVFFSGVICISIIEGFICKVKSELEDGITNGEESGVKNMKMLQRWITNTIVVCAIPYMVFCGLQSGLEIKASEVNVAEEKQALMENNRDLIRSFRNDCWVTLSDAEKKDRLRKMVKVECENQGIKDVPQVRFCRQWSKYADEFSAVYLPKLNEIWFVNDNWRDMDGERIFKTVLHETKHCQQKYLSEMMEHTTIDEEYRDLSEIRHLKGVQFEMTHTLSENSDDFWEQYYNRETEKEAYAYMYSEFNTYCRYMYE